MKFKKKIQTKKKAEEKEIQRKNNPLQQLRAWMTVFFLHFKYLNKSSCMFLFTLNTIMDQWVGFK